MGSITADLPDEWVVASLNSLVFAAWALIAQGRIAPVVATCTSPATPGYLLPIDVMVGLSTAMTVVTNGGLMMWNIRYEAGRRQRTSVG